MFKAKSSRYRCPTCGFEVGSFDNQESLKLSFGDGTVLTTGFRCGRCIIEFIKETFPEMELVKEKGDDDDELQC